MKSIYDFDDYRPLIRQSLLERKKHLSSAYTFQKLAEACKVQKTYVSSALKGDAHLSDDQIFEACQFLGFSDQEREYVQVLQSFQRSTSPKRRAQLRSSLNSLRKAARSTENHLTEDTEIASKSDLELYYFDPINQLVHIFLTINRYSKSVKDLARHLEVSDVKLKAVLELLQRLGLCAYEDGEYCVLKEQIHLPKDSPVFESHKQLLRLQALERQRKPDSEAYSFSVVFSSDEDTRQWLQGELLNLAKKSQDRVAKSKKEGVYQMQFDLFKW